ncbi:hypothetical protein HMPREF9318_00525 [Streptococcus urinalis FB127-CNA-2]|uniref:Putative aromatic acid exporter C-terminal domain-containing protein n=1 Tax=Streptococcus urinalis 2285-97 TaxID=764291 RepID=G5KGG0_9STRE|nr:hypothetical protein STRUR_1278 [Streptococcus urinalis 2285-97]EKS22327.1 hypothetical protein HMPREF9318_00525 [Streptococcus urinalis FB127-CNA-2]VEF32139.1 membrane protein [Streptococcus urinalis]
MLIDLESEVESAIKLVYKEQHNQLFNLTNYQVHYFEMRRNQNNLLKQMTPKLEKLNLKSKESKLLGELFHETGHQLSEKNSGKSLIDQIEELLETYRSRELPKTREEFEQRALLYQLLHELERFIELKVDFYGYYFESE